MDKYGLFKLGDTVKIIRSMSGCCEGEIGELTACDSTDIPYRVRVPGGTHSWCKEIESVSEFPEPLDKLDIHNIKIHVPTPEISKKVQERLFELGAKWVCTGPIQVRETSSKFLYCEKDLSITYSHSNIEFFDTLSHKEVTYQELLGIKKSTPGYYSFESWYNVMCKDESGFQNTEDTKMESMELKNINKKNLAEAKKLVKESRMNAEVAHAKAQYTNAQDHLDHIDRQIRVLEESKKPYLETLAVFG